LGGTNLGLSSDQPSRTHAPLAELVVFGFNIAEHPHSMSKDILSLSSLFVSDQNHSIVERKDETPGMAR
jgi:hypothetical protein